MVEEIAFAILGLHKKLGIGAQVIHSVRRNGAAAIPDRIAVNIRHADRNPVALHIDGKVFHHHRDVAIIPAPSGRLAVYVCAPAVHQPVDAQRQRVVGACGDIPHHRQRCHCERNGIDGSRGPGLTAAVRAPDIHLARKR